VSHDHYRKKAIMFAETKAYSGIAVKDMEQARQFFGGTLGLKTSEEYGLMWLNLAGGRETLVYEQPQMTPASFTILNFEVCGEGPYIAWFKDASGNVLSVLQER
jgi:catechol 2,3-dioxygenase-like lactoylglutathione lyase family enzyme